MNKGFCIDFIVSACFLPEKMAKLKLYAFEWLAFLVSDDFLSLFRSYDFFLSSFADSLKCYKFAHII